MQGTKQARAQADARLDEVLAGLGFEGWLLGRLGPPTEIGVCHGKRAEVTLSWPNVDCQQVHYVQFGTASRKWRCPLCERRHPQSAGEQ